MNKLIANLLGFLNGFAALIFLIGGFALSRDMGWNPILGLVFGALVAVIVCGFIAVLIDMRDEIILLREALEKSTGFSHSKETTNDMATSSNPRVVEKTKEIAEVKKGPIDPNATCPNCDVGIRIEDKSCWKCDSRFIDPQGWKPIPGYPKKVKK